MTQTALVLGANGRFGRNMVLALQAAGWQVRCFDRAVDTLATAARGVDVIVHGWNPTYDCWALEVPLQTDAVIGAARANNATVMIPGNVYVYGKPAPERFAEDTPHGADNPLGQVRVRMEQAFARSGVQTIVLRGGDFLDTEPSGNWFDRILVKDLNKGRLVCPGDPDIPRAWAYLPDYCRAMVALAEKRAELPVFSSLNYEGYTLSGAQMAGMLGVTAKKMSWLPIYLAVPFWKLARYLLEMRYIWDKPHRLDGAGFRALLPEFRETPVEEALYRAASFKINPDQPVIRARPAV